MTEAKRNQLFAEVFRDEETAKKLLAMSPEEVAAYMAEKGLTFSLEEIREVGEEIQKKIDAAGRGELSEEDLQDVAGGKGEFVAGLAFGVLIGLSMGGW